MNRVRRTWGWFLLLVLFVGIIGCSKEYSGPSADLVIHNAKVVTIDSDQRRAEAVAIKGEKIIGVTSNRKIKAYIDEATTKIIDAKGRLMVPGLNDAHVHFLSGGRSLLNLDFRYITDVMVIQRMVRDRVVQSKPGEVIRGRGWDHELFPDKKWPTRGILDAVAPNTPVILSRTDGHSVWVNSVVIRNSGITKYTPDPPGGTIVKDPSTGEPTGIFKESATGLLKISSTYPLSRKNQMKQTEKVLQLALDEAMRTGVTSLSHLNGNHELLQKFKDEGKLTARVTFNMWLTKDKKQLKEFDALRKQYPPENDWLRFGYLKGFIDGTLGSGTALMFEPFEDDPSTSGLRQMPYEELEEKVVASDKIGFQIGIHAIGTKGNHWILNAYEKARKVNGERDSRHRSEHAQLLADDDIPRFASLGVIASMQPTHCITDKRFAEKRIGLDRCRGAYAWQRLLDTGAQLSFGTDWPVEPLDPLEGLYGAVTRKDRAGEEGEGWFPDQKLSMEKAIELYTLGGAYGEFMEDRKGKIKEGFLADLVIFNQDLMKIPADMIMKSKVDITIVGGKVVYEREGDK
jgi:predicted amidohydrolase YtcJ